MASPSTSDLRRPIRPEQAWPGGTKKLRCLQCDQVFTSKQKSERHCHRCRACLHHDEPPLGWRSHG